jgi:hypothetical protein
MAVSAVALDAYATMDATTWGALALVLTALGGALTWVAWKRRGLAAAVRGLAWTLVPLALWLTGTLKLAASIVADVSHWAVHFAFSPVVWVGVALAGGAVGLFLVSAIMRTRGIGVREGVRPSRSSRRAARSSLRSSGAESGTALPSSGTDRTTAPKRSRAPKNDDIEGLDEIEAILKKHGI